MASSGASRGEPDSVFAIARRYPNAFAFDTDQELFGFDAALLIGGATPGTFERAR